MMQKSKNHGILLEKLQNSRCQFTVIYSVKKRLIDKHFCFLPSQQSVMYHRLTK